MSDASLPDDLSRWPSDPYRLLGLPRNVGQREARRAYTRLIRIYKPETHPAHFQRIRQAYEAIHSRVESHEPDDDPVPPEPASGGDPLEESAETVTRQPTSPETRLERTSRPRRPDRRPVSIEGRIDAARKLIRSGDLALGYRQLAELQRQYPAHEEPAVQLYWLLRLDPGLDTEREPADWLVQGMLARGPGGRLLELYRRELDARPAEALAPRCTQLLERPAPTERTFDLLTRRWSAAGRVSAWPVIGADVGKHRDRYLPDDRQSWARLLVAAVHQLAWARDAEGEMLFQQCRAELDELSDLHINISTELDECEALLELARGPELGGHLDVPYSLIELVQDSFGPAERCRPALLNVLEQWSERPIEALDALDRLKSCSTVALGRIAQLVKGLGGAQGGEADGLEELIFDQCRRTVGLYSRKTRLVLLELFLREWVTIEQFIQIVATAPEGVRFELATIVDEDLPLQTVVSGVQAFRS